MLDPKTGRPTWLFWTTIVLMLVGMAAVAWWVR